jgi:hypothetical protein
VSLFRRKTSEGYSLDELVGGEDRAPSPLALDGWQKRLGAITKDPPGPSDLTLSAFTLVRGGDLFESPKTKRVETPRSLLDTYRERLALHPNKAAKEEREAAMQGILRVIAGNPAVCRRMLLAKPLEIVIIPKGRDYREFGFPPHTNPRAAGIFWNGPKDPSAMIGLREELIVEKPYLMIHEMAHAVHLLGFTQKEREDIDKMLVPVYRSRRWVEEVVAIYAERAFGADYTEAELSSPDLYGKTRREWTDRAVFSLFTEELFRPSLSSTGSARSSGGAPRSGR